MRIILTAAERAEIEAATEAEDVLPVMGRLFPSYTGCDDIEVEGFLRALLAHAEVVTGAITICHDPKHSEWYCVTCGRRP